MTIRECSDKEHVEKVKKKLQENLEKYGARYCPCKVRHIEENICPCQEFLNQGSGICHCGKYEKIAD